MLAQGTIINNRYRIVKLLGQGGFGAVYRAWDINLNRPCALKINLDTSLEAQRQFQREASTLAALSHSNLPRVTDHFFVQGQGQYLIMDYVDGEDLEAILAREGQLSPERALPIISQVAVALSYLHQQSPPIIHRDIKPANIRITADGHVYLVDFGLVKLYDQQLRTTIGARAVTPGYSPPEQYGQGNTDVRTDVYALAATLYAMLTGAQPQESVQRIVDDKLQPAHELVPTINLQISQTLLRAMSLSPTGRYQKVDEFVTSLTQPIPKGGHSAQSDPTVKISSPKKSQPATKASGTSPVWWVLGTAVVLSGVFFFIVLPAMRDQTAQEIAQQMTRQAVSTRMIETRTAETAVAATVQAEATEAAQRAIIATIQAGASTRPAFGPLAGSLMHRDDNFITTFPSGVALRDFMVEAFFITPYDVSRGSWDYGFLLRHVDGNDQFRLSITSGQVWMFGNRSGDTWDLLGSGSVPGLQIYPHSVNHVRFIARESQGWLYVNNTFVTELDLSSRFSSGDVVIATGLNSGNEIAGEESRYSGFTVWSLP